MENYDDEALRRLGDAPLAELNEVDDRPVRRARPEDVDPSKLSAADRQRILAKDKERRIKEQKEALVNRRILKEEIAREQNRLPSAFGDVADAHSEDEIVAGINKNMLGRMNRIQFINKELSELVYLSSGQLVLLGASSGKGKSTAAANVAYSMIQQGKRVLYVSNEETKAHVFDRVACLASSTSIYRLNHSLLTPNEISALTAAAVGLRDHLKVVDLDYRGNSNIVVSVEGVLAVLEEAVGAFDAVIVDYYSNVRMSTEHPAYTANQVQDLFTLKVDAIKNKFNGPIIVFAQMWPAQKNDSRNPSDRIKGWRSIVDKATVFCELIADKENFVTYFACHKDRHTGNDGYRVKVGFDRDLASYIADPDRDPAFKLRRARWTMDRNLRGLDAAEEEGGSAELDSTQDGADAQFAGADFQAGTALKARS